MADDGAFAAVEGRWEAFLDFCEEKGLGVRGVTDALEEKGVPSLPVFLLFVVMVLAAAFLVAGPLLFGPRTGEIKIILKDGQDGPIQNALVTVSSTAGTPSFPALSDYTDSSGTVVFRSIPAERVHVSASYAGYADASQEVEVVAGKSSPVLLSTDKTQEKSVKVQLAVSGTKDELRTKTELQDEYYNVIDEKAGLNPSFTLKQGQAFNLRVTSPGFGEQTLLNQKAGTSDAFLTIELKPLNQKRVAKVHAIVLDRARRPVEKASVELLSATTGAVLANLTTGEDGAAPAAELEAGAQFKARVTKENYSVAVTELFNAEEDTRVEIVLRSLEDVEKLFVEVRDEDGKLLEAPLVRLYEKTNVGGSAGSAGGAQLNQNQQTAYQIISEQRPPEGNAEFKLEKTREYALAAWENGFLPKFAQKISPGTRVLTLVRASPDNSGRVKVHAKNFDSTDAAGATLAVIAGDGAPLGVGEKVTGVDGVQFFDGLPLGAATIIAEGKGRRGSGAAHSCGSRRMQRLFLLDAKRRRPPPGRRDHRP